MKTYIKRITIYVLIGLLFTTIALLIADGNFEHYDIILDGVLLFLVVTIILERFMMVLYIRVKIPSILRIQLTTLVSLALYTFGVWITRPWLLSKVYNLPIFLATIFPMLLSFAIIAEYLFKKKMKSYNDQLERFKQQK